MCENEQEDLEYGKFDVDLALRQVRSIDEMKSDSMILYYSQRRDANNIKLKDALGKGVDNLKLEDDIKLMEEHKKYDR